MTLSSVQICIAALTAFSAFASAGQSCDTPNGTLEDLSTAANNSYFLKWRPTFHFQAPNSWMNDPNIGYYDTASQKWFMGYQYHHAHVNWGNISIGGAFSDDLIHWTDSGAGWQDPTVIGTGPNGSYDHLGVFSGATVENGYMGYPTAFYTSVSRLPIGWSIPYLTGSETQSFAYTKDNGVTWIKYSQGNPVIPHPPSDLNVTGWRDPLIFRDANFAAVLQDADDTVYMTLSSGQRPTAGGRLLLYRSQDSNLTEWDYLGVMFSAHGNESYSVFSGNYGFNFEMSGYRSLVSEEGDVLHVVTFGTEGGRTDANGNATHGNHWPLFAAGSMNLSGVLNASMSGVLDWGETYAYLGIQDPVNNRHLLWDWIYEDDNGYGMLAKGWQGSLGLPRVLSVKTIKGVTDSKARATEKGSWDAKEESDGTFTIRTLGQEPIPEVCQLRSTATQHTFPATKVNSTGYQKVITAQSSNYELSVTLTLTTNSIAGLTLRKSPTSCEQTDLYIDVANEVIIVDRSAGSLYYQFNNATEQGKFRLWQVNGQLQPLDLHIFVDNSIVEIFANGVFCLTTRIYPTAEDANELGYLVKQGSVEYGELQIWDGLDKAWPERPENSSVPLVFDNATITQNGTLWAGN